MKKGRYSFSNRIPYGSKIDEALRLSKEREARYYLKKAELVLETRLQKAVARTKSAHSEAELNSRLWRLRIIESQLKRVERVLKN